MKIISALVASIFFAMPFTMCAIPSYQEITSGRIPTANPGELRRYSVTSTALGDNIIVDVWTPEGYIAGSGKKYPVLYVHDGQNLFDPSFSFANVAWELDSKTQALINSGIIEAPIIVGINNRGSKNLRPNDYFPEKVLNYIPESDRNRTKIFETCKDGFYGDEEAAFVTGELKPLIDHLYDTDPQPSHTFAMGSSMGGLASLYLLCEYPDVFGAAACMSTHWIGSIDLNSDYSMNDDPVCAKAILAYMNANLPSPANHRLYLDQGTTGWDAVYLKYEVTARQIAIEHGYSTENETLETYTASGAGHNEWFWQQRIDRPLRFLLDKELFAGIESVTVPTFDNEIYVSLSGITYTTSDASTLPAGIYLHNRRKIAIGLHR